MKRDEIGVVLDELSQHMDLTLGINTFYELAGGLQDGHNILIRAEAIDTGNNLEFIETLGRLEMGWSMAIRNRDTYYRVYSKTRRGQLSLSL